jgi:hypothetical protein
MSIHWFDPDGSLSLLGCFVIVVGSGLIAALASSLGLVDLGDDEDT